MSFLDQGLSNDVFISTLQPPQRNLRTRLTKLAVVRIGDGAAINKFCCVSPHNYKIDCMEFTECVISDGCVIGASSTFSGSSRMNDGAELDSFSMALRGAVLTAGRWVGYPAMLEADKRRNRAKNVRAQ